MQTRFLRLLTLLVVAAALAFPFFLALEKIHTPDCFWHLATGEWILAHGQAPHTDSFSSTVQGKPWMDWEWLFQVMIHVVYARGGFDALVIAKSLLVALAALVIFSTSRRNGAQPLLAALAVLAAFVAVHGRLDVQPDVLMFLFTALTLAMLEAARLGSKDSSRGRYWWLLGLPVVEMIWVNMHASFPLGLCLAGAYLVGELVWAICSPDAKSGSRSRGISPIIYLGACLLVCAAACLANPYGWRLIGHVIEQSRHAGPAGMINEWIPTRLLLVELPNWALLTFWWLFWLTPLTLAARLLVERRKFPWAHALVVAGMSVLALKANRFTGLYVVATIPILAGAVAAVWQKIVGCERLKDLTLSLRPACAGLISNPAIMRTMQFAAILFVGALALFLNWAVISNRWSIQENRASRFGVGMDEQLAPLRALDVMKKLPPELGLFNTDVSGGALIWRLYPEWRVFTDGRANLYGREFMNQYRAALANPLEWEKWMQERGVNVAYVQYGTEEAFLVQRLAKSSTWKLFYFDHAACIFIHRSALEKLSPQVKALGAAPELLSQAATAQSYAHRLANEVAGQNPYNRARVLTTIGNFLMTIGEGAAARPLFNETVALCPSISAAWMRLAQLALQENKLDEAMAFTTQLLARNPRFYQARLMQAQIRAVQGDTGDAVALAEQVLRQQPHSSKAWVVRAQLWVRQRNTSEAIRALRRAVAEGGEDAGVYAFLGLLLEKEGRYEEAIQAYENCLRVWQGAPEQQEAYRRQINLLRSIGRDKKFTPP